MGRAAERPTAAPRWSGAGAETVMEGRSVRLNLALAFALE